MPGTELEAWVTPVNSKSANTLLSGTSVLWTICYVLDLLRGVLWDSEEMKARECGWSVRHYAETETAQGHHLPCLFPHHRGGSNSSFLLGLDSCRKAGAMPSVTPGTQPVGCGVVSPQPVTALQQLLLLVFSLVTMVLCWALL